MDNSQSAFLTGKNFCFLSTQSGFKWIIDSGATDHITPHLHLFHSYQIVSKPCFITMPTGKQVQVQHVGTVQLSPSIILQGVLHVPDFQFSLLSASELTKQLSVNIVFSPNVCYLQGLLKNKPVVLSEEFGGLYVINSQTVGTALQSLSTSCFSSLSLSELWHCRLGMY